MKELNEMSSRQIAVNNRKIRAESDFQQGMKRADLDRRTSRDAAAILERTTVESLERSLREHLHLLESEHHQKLFDAEAKLRSLLQNLKIEADQLKQRSRTDAHLLAQGTATLTAKRRRIDGDHADVRRVLEESYQREKRRLEDATRQSIQKAQADHRSTDSLAERAYAHRVEELKAELERAKRG